jgi:GTPase SAR1 family protein
VVLADAEFTTITIRTLGESYHMALLDTPGSEKASDTRISWFMRCSAYVIVFAIHSRASFNEVETFLSQIRLANQNTKSLSVLPIVLLGNQVDRENEREVSTMEAQAFARKHDIHYFECSARLKITLLDFMEQIPTLVQRKMSAQQMQSHESFIDFWKLAQNARSLFRMRVCRQSTQSMHLPRCIGVVWRRQSIGLNHDALCLCSLIYHRQTLLLKRFKAPPIQQILYVMA